MRPATSSLLRDRPHRRRNALTGEWVFVSPQRVRRPWQGKIEAAAGGVASQYDPDCYLCPGNARANGAHNPRYTSTYVFPNDFPAFLDEGPLLQESRGSEDSLLHAEPHAGTCRVICYSPRHDLTLAQMPVAEIRCVVDSWIAQCTELGSRWRWVQILENKGELMGCSNPHPHGQVWASDFMPTEAVKEIEQQQTWFERTGSPLLLDYAGIEAAAGDRVVALNADWLVVVPWWAFWPFETLLLPRRRSVTILPELTMTEQASLAEILSRVLVGYDRLFGISFPYSFGWHGAPTGCDAVPASARGYQLHAHFFPPLLRSATVRKFVAGYELLAEAQRDLTPEWAAERLRDTGPAERAR